jgi:hypothetical protein
MGAEGREEKPVSIFKKTVGDFTLSVSAPLPIWIEIKHSGYHSTGALRFAADDLQDLIYALRCAEINVCSQMETKP